jgi:hypothetical protein
MATSDVAFTNYADQTCGAWQPGDFATGVLNFVQDILH